MEAAVAEKTPFMVLACFSGDGATAFAADYQFITVAFQPTTGIWLSAANTEGGRSDLQRTITFRLFQQRNFGEIEVVRILSASLDCLEIFFVLTVTCLFQHPAVRHPQTGSDDLLYQPTILQTQIVIAVGIESGLEQHIFAVAEDLAGALGVKVESARHSSIHCKKNHADPICKIREATGLIASVSQPMTGRPRVISVGHLQKIAGMDGQNAGSGSSQRIESIGQPGIG